MKTITAYHFFGNTLRDGSDVPPNGETLGVDPARLELCAYGLHASRCPRDALNYAPGINLAVVELSGEIIEGDDKLCASERTIIARIDATDLLRQFARECALDVIHLWDAPEVVRRYLDTGGESLRREAYYAARAANATYATNAARAARAAANAARAAQATYAANAANAANAAYEKQRTRLQSMVDKAFTELGYT